MRGALVLAVTVAALAGLSGCLGCFSHGSFFVVWRDPGLYPAFDGKPAWGEANQTGLPFDLATAGIPAEGGFLQGVHWARDGVGLTVAGHGPRVAVSAMFHPANASHVEASGQEFLRRTTDLQDAEVAEAAAALASNTSTERQWSFARHWIDASRLRLEDLYVEEGGGPLVVSYGLVGNWNPVQLRDWNFSFWIKTKQGHVDGGELTVFSTGDAKYSYSGDRSSEAKAIRHTKDVLGHAGLPATMERPSAIFSNSCMS